MCLINFLLLLLVLVLLLEVSGSFCIFLMVTVSLILSTIAISYLERLVSEITYYVLGGTLNCTCSLTCNVQNGTEVITDCGISMQIVTVRSRILRTATQNLEHMMCST